VGLDIISEKIFSGSCGIQILGCRIKIEWFKNKELKSKKYKIKDLNSMEGFKYG